MEITTVANLPLALRAHGLCRRATRYRFRLATLLCMRPCSWRCSTTTTSTSLPRTYIHLSRWEGLRRFRQFLTMCCSSRMKAAEDPTPTYRVPRATTRSKSGVRCCGSHNHNVVSNTTSAIATQATERALAWCPHLWQRASQIEIVLLTRMSDSCHLRLVGRQMVRSGTSKSRNGPN